MNLKRTSPATWIALTALFFAVGGPSQIANAASALINGKNIKKGSIEADRLTAKARQQLKGARGAQGEPGLSASSTTPGPKGDTGATGPAGAKGDTGPAGAKGDTGAKGDQGLPGTPGTPGPPGTPGINGADGTDATINGVAAGGALSGTFPNPGLATGAVTSAAIADGTIEGADVGVGQLTGSHIGAGSVTGDRLAPNTLTQLQIGGNGVATTEFKQSSSSGGGATIAVDGLTGGLANGVLAGDCEEGSFAIPTPLFSGDGTVIDDYLLLQARGGWPPALTYIAKRDNSSGFRIVVCNASKNDVTSTAMQTADLDYLLIEG